MDIDDGIDEIRSPLYGKPKSVQEHIDKILIGESGQSYLGTVLRSMLS